MNEMKPVFNPVEVKLRNELRKEYLKAIQDEEVSCFYDVRNFMGSNEKYLEGGFE